MEKASMFDKVQLIFKPKKDRNTTKKKKTRKRVLRVRNKYSMLSSAQ